MKVRATKEGYLTYYRMPGDEFEVTEAQFHDSWMEEVDEEDKPVKRAPKAPAPKSKSSDDDVL